MRVLCLGEALVDLVCERHVDNVSEVDAFVPHFGGAIANVAVTAAREGGSVALAGGAGDDEWGRWLRDRLMEEGVGLEWFRLVEGLATPLAIVTVAPSGEPSFSLYGEGIGKVIEAVGPFLAEAVSACEGLFFSSNTLVSEAERELTMAARDQALALGLPVVFDPNVRLHRWPSPGRVTTVAGECVRDAFLVKCNQPEARLLTGEVDPERAADALVAGGARHVVVTLGADGAILRGELRADVPGEPARVIDATGAGDAFLGVLLARLSSSDFYSPALAAALPDAVEAGARATERWGAVG
ncbi:MAG: fructokinase [Solirubrobacteraceae bacterium]|nr:fructokinase [Solirubrobacteraceae bacterium]